MFSHIISETSAMQHDAADGDAQEVAQIPTLACSVTTGLDSSQVPLVGDSFRLQQYAVTNFKSLNQN